MSRDIAVATGMNSVNARTLEIVAKQSAVLSLQIVARDTVALIQVVQAVCADAVIVGDVVASAAYTIA